MVAKAWRQESALEIRNGDWMTPVLQRPICYTSRIHLSQLQLCTPRIDATAGDIQNPLRLQQDIAFSRNEMDGN